MTAIPRHPSEASPPPHRDGVVDESAENFDADFAGFATSDRRHTDAGRDELLSERAEALLGAVAAARGARP